MLFRSTGNRCGWATDMTNLALRARVELDLEKKYSPEQIAGRLDNTLAGLGRLAAS